MENKKHTSSDEEIDISVFVSPAEDTDDDEGDWRGVTRRDKYGFELEEDMYSEVFIRNASRVSTLEEKSEKEWIKLFRRSKTDSPPKNKIRTLAHKYGIPPQYRKEVRTI